ncbi:hypothetical protein [Williamsia herbipolensis]
MSADGIPVFVGSTATADIVLTPSTHKSVAVEALRAAGHHISV